MQIKEEDIQLDDEMKDINEPSRLTEHDEGIRVTNKTAMEGDQSRSIY